MNKVKTTNFSIPIIIFSLIVISSIYINNAKKNNAKNLQNKEDLIINEISRVLNECFDLENKNKRTLKKSNELIEYCLKEYGYKN
tara:strand:- start:2 stop:256 length:255 start_codon:yes stop_codon:yes gene_type:complete